MKIKKFTPLFVALLCLVLTLHVYSIEYVDCTEDAYDGEGCQQASDDCVKVQVGELEVCIGNIKDDGCSQEERRCLTSTPHYDCIEDAANCYGTYEYCGCNYNYTQSKCVIDTGDCDDDDCTGTFWTADSIAN